MVSTKKTKKKISSIFNKKSSKAAQTILEEANTVEEATTKSTDPKSSDHYENKVETKSFVSILVAVSKETREEVAQLKPKKKKKKNKKKSREGGGGEEEATPKDDAEDRDAAEEHSADEKSTDEEGKDDEPAEEKAKEPKPASNKTEAVVEEKPAQEEPKPIERETVAVEEKQLFATEESTEVHLETTSAVLVEDKAAADNEEEAPATVVEITKSEEEATDVIKNEEEASAPARRRLDENAVVNEDVPVQENIEDNTTPPSLMATGITAFADVISDPLGAFEEDAEPVAVAKDTSKVIDTKIKAEAETKTAPINVSIGNKSSNTSNEKSSEEEAKVADVMEKASTNETDFFAQSVDCNMCTLQDVQEFGVTAAASTAACVAPITGLVRSSFSEADEKHVESDAAAEAKEEKPASKDTDTETETETVAVEEKQLAAREDDQSQEGAEATGIEDDMQEQDTTDMDMKRASAEEESCPKDTAPNETIPEGLASDGNGVCNLEEVATGTDPVKDTKTSQALADEDSNGLSDAAENSLVTLLDKADTDLDCAGDKEEQAVVTDSADGTCPSGDLENAHGDRCNTGATEAEEYSDGADPVNPQDKPSSVANGDLDGQIDAVNEPEYIAELEPIIEETETEEKDAEPAAEPATEKSTCTEEAIIAASTNKVEEDSTEEDPHKEQELEAAKQTSTARVRVSAAARIRARARSRGRDRGRSLEPIAEEPKAQKKRTKRRKARAKDAKKDEESPSPTDEDENDDRSYHWKIDCAGQNICTLRFGAASAAASVDALTKMVGNSFPGSSADEEAVADTKEVNQEDKKEEESSEE